MIKYKSILAAIVLTGSLAFAEEAGPFGWSRVISTNQDFVKIETLGAPAKAMYERLAETRTTSNDIDSWAVLSSQTLMCGRKVDGETAAYRCIYYIDSAGNFTPAPELSAAALIGVW